MVRYFFCISYIGTKYRGTQKIKGYVNETIQDVVESALSSLKISNTPTTCFASRTDKGVHALMNAFHVDLHHKLPNEVLQPHLISSSVNKYLKENNHEILVSNVCVVPDTFHTRFNAKMRSYFYRLAIVNPDFKAKCQFQHNLTEFLPISEVNRCLAVSSDLDINMVKRTIEMFCGEHDFNTFTKGILREPWKNTRRSIEEFTFYETNNINNIKDPRYSNISMWEFYIKSQSFLYHQVRKLVGTALSVGFGCLSLENVKTMLEKPGPDEWKHCFLPTASGLYLADIQYNKEDFSSDTGKQALSSGMG